MSPEDIHDLREVKQDVVKEARSRCAADPGEVADPADLV